MCVSGGTHPRTCLGIKEHMENSLMAQFKLTQVEYLKHWFQYTHCTFESLSSGGG